MSATFRQIDFDIIRKRLEATQDWLNSVGVKTKDTRFSDILENVNVICDYRGKDKIQDLVDHFDNELLWYALLESNAFSDIHQAFRSFKSHQIPRAKLTEILKGPFLPRDEEPEAQNTGKRGQALTCDMNREIGSFSRADLF